VLDTTQIMDDEAREAAILGLTAGAVRAMQAGQDAVIHTAQEEHLVARTRSSGEARGLNVTEISRRVSETMAEAVARILAATGQNRLVVAGGETSAAVCARLGIRAQRIWQELQPGLPSCVSLNEPRRLLVLKSGSFGSPDFLAQAIAHVKSQ
jgi:uncharacterized protein YgbK (DUF1537 family)